MQNVIKKKKNTQSRPDNSIGREAYFWTEKRADFDGFGHPVVNSEKRPFLTMLF